VGSDISAVARDISIREITGHGCHFLNLMRDHTFMSKQLFVLFLAEEDALPSNLKICPLRNGTSLRERARRRSRFRIGANFMIQR